MRLIEVLETNFLLFSLAFGEVGGCHGQLGLVQVVLLSRVVELETMLEH